MIENKKLNKKMIFPVMAAVAITAVGTAALTYSTAIQAATSSTSTTVGKKFGPEKMPGVVGKVASISGSTITLTAMDSKTYTVDAGSAKILKMPEIAAGTAPVAGATRPTPATITISDIKVGDTLMVRGTVSGTSVTATDIVDGKFMGHRGFGGPAGHDDKGRGVRGTVTAVNGTTVTVNIATGTVAVGDKVMVRSTIK